ncbi:PQQ-binding-like beta-propeller repeat protein [candidate division WOR-3 bacterium]|uniref:PQQ-binding-like beta-propeller repeat protein n=1 Tax=candidate division WOR-3 bacterium TaxID=2052148 RepID=A0A9D5K966_UNCW3|nr:PQQ-binding-like beta-propeller repeat protein [candidate division WOR-3 bacterium]MBD3364434.1 PQQ-binding-like beta-propeller repeat protein [candidate division WOR-3 bacterium]
MKRIISSPVKCMILTAGVLMLASCTGPVGTIEISTTPNGATVYIDDTVTQYVTDCVIEEVPEGEHIIKLELDGYSDWDSTVTVEKKEIVTIDVELTEATGTIIVNSDPEGAEIYLDESSTGLFTSDTLTEVPAGDRDIKLSLTDYQDWDTTVNLSDDETITINAVLSKHPGHLVWNYKTGGAVISSPVADENNVYVGSSDNFLYTLDRTDGTLLWRYQTDDSVSSTPAMDNDVLYVGSHDGHLYAIDRTDGTLLWRYNLSAPVFSSPATGEDGTIYVGSAGGLYAINPNNTLKWTYPTSGMVLSSPAIADDGTIYFGSSDSTVYAINASDGTLKWDFDADGAVHSSPAIGEDGTVLIAAADDKLYALYPENGSMKWSYTMDDWSLSSPVVGATGSIFIGGMDGYLYKITGNGTLDWKYYTSIGGINLSTPLVDAEGTCYIGAYDGYVYAIDSQGERTWRYATDAPVYSSAVLYAGVIYIGSDDGNVYALQAKSFCDGPWPMFGHDCFRTGRAD